MSKDKMKLSIVQRMFVAVILGIAVGVGCIFLRNAIGANSEAWTLINQALFVDITSSDGVSGLGLFYIISELFMHMLQVAIVPLVLVSLALSLCKLAQPEKLGRIAVRTIVTFICFYVVAATLAGTVAYLVSQTGVFDVTLPESEISPPCSALPKMRRGGYPSLSIYSTRAPKAFNASTRILIGRFRIRSVPVIVHSPTILDRKAVRKRIAVPAAWMSKSRSFEFSALTITSVSSQSERFSIS